MTPIDTSIGALWPASSARHDAAIGRLLDREFDGLGGMAAEYPLLVGSGNRPRRWLIGSEEEPIGHAAWRVLTLVCGSRRVKACGIGLVTTARQRRGEGLASALVARCLDHAAQEGCVVALLFSENRTLYARHGFGPAGRERITRIPALPASPDALKDVRRGGPRDAAGLLPLLERHPVRVDRSLAEFETLLGIPDTHLWILDGPHGPRAYCVEGKGRDLRGVVHEWAGEARALERLIPGVASYADSDLWLLSPESVAPPCRGESTLGAVCQAAVLRPEGLGAADAVGVFGGPERPATLPFYVWGLDSV